jgi:VWFA-related protein
MTIVRSLVIGAAATAAAIVASPRSVQARQDAGRQAAPTFRTGTTLVEVTMIALDSSGRPVVDLRKDEITLKEDGHARDVAFFRFEGSANREPRALERLPAGLFSNRAEYVAGPPRHVTAVVFDAIHTRPTEQAAALTQVVKYLDAPPLGTRVAVYQLGSRLSIVHDFTDDLASLRAHLQALRSLTDPASPDGGGDSATSVEGFSPEAAEMLKSAIAEMKRQDGQYAETVEDRRRSASLAGLEEIGRHLAGIPGRKSLVWISSGFATQSTHNGFMSVHDAQIRASMRRLATAGIAVYPVDALGLLAPDMGVSATGRGAARGGFAPRKQTGLPDQTHWATMDLMASVTGGRVARNSNEIADGVKLAARDAEASYTVSFYAATVPDDRWHPVEIRTSRRGVHLLVRDGYTNQAPAAAPLDWSEAQWRWAVSTPLSSTVLHMDARVEPVPGQQHAYAVLLLLVPEELHFRTTGSTRTADVDIAVAQRRRNGAIAFQKGAAALAIPATADTSGTVVRYRDRWTLEPDTTGVRLIVRDRATGRYGTLDLPLAHVASK